MHTRQKTSHADGFTLIEVLMVMAVLAIGILAVMTMQLSAASSNTTARKLTDGSNYMTSAFEWMMLQDYDAAAANYNMGPAPQAPYTAQNVVAGNPIPNTQQVDLTVTLGPSGRTLNITYYKADPF